MKNIIMIESLVKTLLATKEIIVDKTDWDASRQEEVRDVYNIHFGNISIKEHKELSYVLITDKYPVELQLDCDELGRALTLEIFIGGKNNFVPMINWKYVQKFEHEKDVINYIGQLFYQRLDPLEMGDFEIFFNKYKEGIIDIGRICPLCNNMNSVELTLEQFDNWLRWYFAEPGYEHIQDALPELSAKERELFITGIDDECFQSMYDSIDEE